MGEGSAKVVNTHPLLGSGRSRHSRGFLQKKVDLEDLPKLSKYDHPRTLSEPFAQAWADEVQKRPDKPSLLRVLHRLNWKTFWLSGLLLLVYLGSQLGFPFLLHALLSFIAEKSDDESAVCLRVIQRRFAPLLFNSWLCLGKTHEVSSKTREKSSSVLILLPTG